MSAATDSSRPVAISVRNLCKKYKIYKKPMDMVVEWLSGRCRHSEFTALDAVSFDILHGQVVGIVGRNGAGKSTLLKIIAGTLDHSEGTVQIHGRVSAILELGTGFNPEYTGRENIIMGGMCLGMSRTEVEAKMESIIAFSELQAFIDQPFKTYSSGMQARLTFSTAISVDPDILIIDEALAAGDALFQAKCYQRVRDIAKSGATVFFVTHSLGTIYELCDSALLLSKGQLLLHGNPRAVGYAYERVLASAVGGGQTGLTIHAERGNGTAPGEDADALVEELSIHNESGLVVSILESGNTYEIRSTVQVRKPLDRISVGFRIQKASGQIVYGISTALLGQHISGQESERVMVSFSFKCTLAAGSYLLGGGVSHFVSDTQFRVLHIIRDKAFEVVSSKQFQGDVDLGAKVKAIEPLQLPQGVRAETSS
jgi:lipopolysaccharide transport system ATP-binding protein